MVKLTSFNHWFTVSVADDGNHYRHQLLTEKEGGWRNVEAELKQLVHFAHEDACSHLRKIAGYSLDPLGLSQVDPTQGYPQCLPMTTLQGYFGEFFAGLLAESNAPFGYNDWEVPAFLFRNHKLAFGYLEHLRQATNVPRAIPGRTGDDCLAFQLDADGNITRALVCEAKCSLSHDNSLISNAHKQISASNVVPVDLLSLVEVLLDREDETSKSWVISIRSLYHRTPENYERYDLVSYICGQSPQRKSTWITQDRPHRNYTGNRYLEAVETHIDNVRGLICSVYGVEQ